MYCSRCGTQLADGSAGCGRCGAPNAAPPPALSGWSSGWGSQPPPPPAAEVALEDAGFWLRFGAHFIDNVIVTVPAVLLFGVSIALAATAGAGGTEQGAGFGLAVLGSGAVVLVGTWLYHALHESSPSGATPGKRALGLRVTDLQGRRIGFARASGRHLGKFLSSLVMNVGYLMAGVTQRKQALHDLLVGTRVVRTRSGGSGVVTGVAAAVAAVFGGVFLIGVLAAIAIPNFLRYQLRARAGEAPAMLAQLARGEEAHRRQAGRFLALSVPRGPPGSVVLRWSAADEEAAAPLGFQGKGATYFTYRVVAGVTDTGEPAYAACAEGDLDGDGEVSAWAVWHPGTDSRGDLVAPEAPCQHHPKLARAVDFSARDPQDQPVRLAPEDVF